MDFERERRCYVCKRPFRERDVFYDAMCAPCAALNRARREQSADLTGRVALVTGGRVKIGFRVALKLLRAGATVVVTTRFANDAWRRFGQEPDFNTWRDRLEVHPLDLRFLLDTERFAASLASRLPRLDVLISNAALTVARPAEWHAEMARLDAEASRALPSGVAPCAPVSTSDGLLGLSLPGEVQGLDRYAQPDDRRERNSWRARVGEVSTRELVSVHAVTALAPFVLVNALRPLLARDVTVDKFVVLVSAVEGQFYRAGKTPRHPHTNMAKAALNMLARTSGEDLARERIWCCAVDTGWVSDQNPAPIAARMADGGFEPPLDEEDGAARVLDPVFRALRGEAPAQGVFLKDYAVAPW
ncbi:MAG: SDR family NAD(P)-dependent oxidoreductase [Polyangiales bacterium]